MLVLYSGMPGSGKSLSSAREIYKYNKRKKDIICNFDLNVEQLKHTDGERCDIICVDNKELTVQFLKDYAMDRGYHLNRKENQCLVVIDECSILFNSRDWNSPGRKEWIEFFIHHRKYGFEFILISQFIDQFDKQIKHLIELEYIHRKVNNYMPLPVKTFVKIEKAVNIKGLKTNCSYFVFKKKYGKLYDTFAIFE